MKKCSTCGVWVWSGTDDECFDCWSARRPEEFRSSQSIRCPACGKLDGDAWDRRFEQGDNEVSCDYCDHEYVVTMDVEITYASPPLNRTKE